MRIRKTAVSDLEQVMQIYAHARAFMRQNNNPSQWVDGYPLEELIKQDIQKQTSYVCVDEDEGILGVFYFAQEADATYAQIDGGSWLNQKPYGVIHRIASGKGRKGVASFCIDWCFSTCPNIRIDTHQDNLAMQKLLSKTGFQKCGTIYIADGSPRIAYQKTAI